MAVMEHPVAAVAPTAPGKLLVDGHVHFHECFTWKTFLDGAAANFARARTALALDHQSPGCLMFTESAGMNQFRRLAEHPDLARLAGWRAECHDGNALTFSHGTREVIVLVAGRQIVTTEGLEVLALGCADELPDGRPIDDVIRDVSARGALPAIPWGFGKWGGRRGQRLRGLIEDDTVPQFYLADNGGRAGQLPRPSLFAWAERQGMVVLGGSDPLPLPRDVARAGSFGFILDGWPSSTEPAAAIKSRLRALAGSPPTFGQLSSLRQMVRAQVGLRWQRRRNTDSRRAVPGQLRVER